MQGGKQIALTDAEKNEIIDAYRNGESKNNIATRLGRSWATIDKIINQSGMEAEADTLRNEERRDVVASGYAVANKVLERHSSPGTIEKIAPSKLATLYNSMMANGRAEQKLQLTYERVMNEALSVAQEELRRIMRESFNSFPAIYSQLVALVDSSSLSARENLLGRKGYLRTELARKRIYAAASPRSSLTNPGEEHPETVQFNGLLIDKDAFMEEMRKLPCALQVEIMEAWAAQDPTSIKA